MWDRFWWIIVGVCWSWSSQSAHAPPHWVFILTILTRLSYSLEENPPALFTRTQKYTAMYNHAYIPIQYSLHNARSNMKCVRLISHTQQNLYYMFSNICICVKYTKAYCFTLIKWSEWLKSKTIDQWSLIIITTQTYMLGWWWMGWC